MLKLDPNLENSLTGPKIVYLGGFETHFGITLVLTNGSWLKEKELKMLNFPVQIIRY